MHLLHIGDDGDFSLAEFYGKQIPTYAILSHTWIATYEEVTFKDIMKGRGKGKAGYGKLNFIAKQAAVDKLEYFWVDTCCIDKASSAELQEAINSMFRWYQNSSKCYVYLADVSSGGPDNVVGGSPNTSSQPWKEAFLRSRWFTRGWTLQELLAPKEVEFFSSEGNFLGDKSTLESDIEKITKIPMDILQGTYDHLLKYGVDDRLSWAIERQTTREEDAAYSLLGLFDLHIPLLYGEGRNKAFMRLHRERESVIAYEISHNSAKDDVQLESSAGDARSRRPVMQGIPRDAPLKRTASEAFLGSPVSQARKVTIIPSPHVVKQGMDTEEPSHEIAGDPGTDNSVADHIDDNYISQSSHDSTPEAFTSPDADMQAWWDDTIARNMNVSDYYTHVAVLLIKWSDELDDLRTRDEVEELNDLFSERFHFNTKIVELDVASKPQHQLNRHMTSFVIDNDGPNKLLIVYYSGHAIYQDSLELTAARDSALNTGFIRYARANWNKAERMLLEDVEADVLTIFDTSFAANATEDPSSTSRSALGSAGSTRGLPKASKPASAFIDPDQSRRYQMMTAAGVDSTTAAPGNNSFTRALIDGLVALLNENRDRPISTFRLNQRILLDPRRRDTPSLLWNRLAASEGHISLKPMKQVGTSDQRGPVGRVGGRLTLELDLRDESLNQEQIQYLATALTKSLRGKAVLGLRGINWRGMVPVRQDQFLLVAVIMLAIVRWKRVVRKPREERMSSRFVEDDSMNDEESPIDMLDAPSPS